MYEPLAPAKPEIAASAVRSERGGYIAGFLFVIALIVGGGVGLSHALRTERAEPGADDYLRIVDEFLDTRPRQTFIPRAGGLLQVFGPGSYGGGSCGRLCTLSESCPFSAVAGLCRFDVYDNALAAIYYTARGKFDKAKAILDGFLYYMYVKRQETNDKVTTGPEQGLPSGRYLNLLAASYTNARSIPGQYEGAGVADGAVDTGNNAWVGIAMLRYAAATQDACYATAGCDMLFALNRFASCDDQLGGFRARLAPYPMNYRSTEHNIDMFALASMCRNVSLASHAASFVAQMYDRDEGHAGTYVAGTTNDERCTTNVATGPQVVVPADTQTWNFLSGVDPRLERKASSLGFVARPAGSGGLWEADADLIGAPSRAGAGAGKGAVTAASGEGPRGVGDTYFGARFSSSGSGIQWENSAAATLALLKLLSTPPDLLAAASPDASQLAQIRRAANDGRDSLKRLLRTYGAVPSSILGGNYEMWTQRFNASAHSPTFPGGSDSGLGWTYLRYPHVASTVWAALAVMYQFEEGAPVREMANPYAAAEGFSDAIYSGADLCLGPKPAPDLALCALFPRCAAAGLEGDCCPSPNGKNLGCCDTPASCGRHPRCRAANLTGDCCPAQNGAVLGCC